MTTHRCIPANWHCDGDNDYYIFTEDFHCVTTHRCIPANWHCNNTNDGDNDYYIFTEDFRCATTHRCIPANWHCDGDNDCGDSSDEPTYCGKFWTFLLLFSEVLKPYF